MNWIDILLLVIIGVSLVWGLKTGVMKTAFMAVGMVVGWWLAGQYADDVGGIVSGVAFLNSIVTVVAYWAIIAASGVAASKALGMIRPLIVIGTLGTAGLADRLGGVVLGLIVGLVLASAAIIVLTRLSSDFTVTTPDVSIPGTEKTVVSGGEEIAAIENRRESLINSLAASKVVAAFLAVRGALPDGMLGFVPGDFNAGFDILEKYMPG